MPLLRRVSGPDGQRGDVPGWVLITLMTALIVAALVTVASDTLQDILKNALCTVTPTDAC